MVDRLRVQTLRKAGYGLSEVARETGVSVSSVRRIVKEPVLEEVASGPTPRTRGVGRPSAVEGFRPQIEELLEEDGALPTVEILSRLRSMGYSGGKSAVYALVREVRPPKAEPPEVRFEGVPGEFSQHDFGQVKVTYADGACERIRFFASRLKFSRWTHVVPVADEKVESLIRALLMAFEAFGGVPLRAVFDNPKTIVTSRKGAPVEWNTTFVHVPVDYGFGVELCWPRRPNQKGSVENLVGWVKSSFFKVRRFHDRQDLDEQLAAWVDEVNLERPSRATNQTPSERIAAERERLKPLALAPEEYALRVPVTVRTTGFVEYAGVRYSMPPRTIGMPATLFLYPKRVRLLARDGTEVEHPRTPLVGKTSYRSEDRVAKLAAVHGKRAKLYEQRQEILELGPPAERLLTEWVHNGRFHWKYQVESLHGLLLCHGAQRTLAAIERVLADGRYHVKAIAWLLHKEAV